MSNNTKIFQGDTTDTWLVSPFEEDQTTFVLSDGGWTCRSVVVNKLYGDVIIDLPVTAKTDDDLWFKPSLYYPHTARLDADKKYIWIVEVENLTTVPVYRKEYHIDLIVKQQGASATDEIFYTYDVKNIGTEENSYSDRNTILIEESSNVQTLIDPNTIVKIQLLNSVGDITQTVGYISNSDYSGNTGVYREVKLMEPVNNSESPTTIKFVAKA